MKFVILRLCVTCLKDDTENKYMSEEIYVNQVIGLKGKMVNAVISVFSSLFLLQNNNQFDFEKLLKFLLIFP